MKMEAHQLGKIVVKEEECVISKQVYIRYMYMVYILSSKFHIDSYIGN